MSSAMENLHHYHQLFKTKPIIHHFWPLRPLLSPPGQPSIPAYHWAYESMLDNLRKELLERQNAEANEEVERVEAMKSTRWTSVDKEAFWLFSGLYRYEDKEAEWGVRETMEKLQKLRVAELDSESEVTGKVNSELENIGEKRNVSIETSDNTCSEEYGQDKNYSVVSTDENDFDWDTIQEI